MTSLYSFLSSRGAYFAINALVIVVMIGVFFFRVGQRQDQIEQSLLERANQVAHRVAKSVEPTLWNIYQKSADRKYTEAVSSAILDSELAADYLGAVVVYGNFAHVFMGRKKLADKKIVNFRKGDRRYFKVSGYDVISVPVRQGKMSIGSVSVFFNAGHNVSRMQRIRIGEFIQGCLLALIFIFILNISRQAHLSKVSAEKSLVSLKITQDQLIEAEKMAALGSLVAGVAHEINTPLGVSLTSTSYIEECSNTLLEAIESNTLTKEKLEDNLADIINGTNLSLNSLHRVASLVATFKELAADRGEDEVRSLYIRDYITQIMSTLSMTLYDHHVQFNVLPCDEIEIVSIPLALSQVITSLTGNSIKHAFEGKTGGIITIGIQQLDENHIQISYQDDGIGMSKEVTENIFEPFYTTTRHSGGVGLDMNIIYNIVHKKLAGKIRVHSEVWQGAEFIITLPIKLAMAKSDAMGL